VRMTRGGAAVNAAGEGSVALLLTSEFARPFFRLLRLSGYSTSIDALLRRRRPTNSLNLLLPTETLLHPNLLALPTRSSVTFSSARVKTARERGEVRFVAGFEGFFDGEGGGSRGFAVVEGGTADADDGGGAVTAFCTETETVSIEEGRERRESKKRTVENDGTRRTRTRMAAQRARMPTPHRPLPRTRFRTAMRQRSCSSRRMRVVKPPAEASILLRNLRRAEGGVAIRARPRTPERFRRRRVSRIPTGEEGGSFGGGSNGRFGPWANTRQVEGS
jgi:hypothetical protein